MIQRDARGRAYTTDQTEARKWRVQDRQIDYHAIKNGLPQIPRYVVFTTFIKGEQRRWYLPPSQGRAPSVPSPNYIEVKSNYTLRPHQLKAMDFISKQVDDCKRSCLVVSGTATGKCFGEDTGIIMYDGTIKKVQNIKIGDRLMGPDSKSRKVLSTTMGYDKLYKIETLDGESFVCNKDHILVLQASYNRRGYKQGENIYVSVKEYLSFSENKKHQFKIIKSSGIEFKEKALPLDPYYLGYRLGNGCSNGPELEINITHKKIINYFENFAKSLGLYSNINYSEGKGSCRFSISNNNKLKKRSRNKHSIGLRNILRKLGVLSNKHIPNNYLYNSSKNRYQLLAGLLDSDGSLDKHDMTTIIFNNTNKKIIDGVYYLVKSLGLCAKIRQRLTHSQYGDNCISWNISISGETYKIPMKHKIPNKRKLNKSVLRTGFLIKEIKKGKYYGFMTNKDHLFLLDNFIISHNSWMMMGVISMLHKKTVIVVPTMIIGQGIYEKISPFVDVKLMTAQKYRTAKKKPDVLILSGSSFNNIYTQVQEDGYTILITDESHHLSKKRVDQINLWKGDFICGFTATPERKEYGVESFEKYFGSIYDTEQQALPVHVLKYEYRYNYNINEVIKSQEGLSPDSPEFYRRLYAINDDRTEHLKMIIEKLKTKGFTKMIVFTDRRAHIEQIKRIIPEAIQLTGSEDKQIFNEMIKDKSEYLIVALEQCAGEGFDLPNLECGILFVSSSWSNTIDQTAGRMRRFSEGKTEAFYVDFVDMITIMGGKTKTLGWYERNKIYKQKDWLVESFEDYIGIEF